MNSVRPYHVATGFAVAVERVDGIRPYGVGVR